MDRTGIIVVTICIILLGLWFVEERDYYSPPPPPPVATNSVAAPQREAKAPVAPSTSPPAPAGFVFNTNAPEHLIVITNAYARYTFTSRGGGLKSVALLDYPETVSARWKQKTPAGGVAMLNTHAPAPVMAILGGSNLMGDGEFTLTRTADDDVRAEKTLVDGLRIVKEFHIGSDYLVDATVRLENISRKPISLPAQKWMVGTATPMGPDDNGAEEGVMWFNGTKDKQISLSYFSTNTTFLWFFPRTPKTEYREGVDNVVWAAAHNQYFALIAMPKTNRPAQQVVAWPVTLPRFSNIEQTTNAPLPEGIQTALLYPAQTLGINQVIERQITLFAGPKEYRTLARIGEKFNNHADLVMNFGHFWGFFAKALLVAMNWLHDVTKLGYGWIIVLITIILRVVFWPFTAMSIRSAKKMQRLAPEVNALKEKYKNDPQKLTQKQMELWRKHKVNPISGCLPAFIQMPVFIGFFTMLRSAIELRGARFLWVSDLTKPDTLFMIPGINFPFNLLPLLMGGAMLWQSHLQPPSPGMDQSQAKIMRYFPLIMLLFLYNYSSGLALYMTVSTLLSVLQTMLTKNLRDPAAAPAASAALTPPLKKKK